ncbi:MAG: hypothetical protein DHS80DRAFT_31479 [Piptocephalis tieghemiana]|nr:MAG: hypothetical protein DHS80DRAFT_31479 [Piptocephalis tieghemiana]
MDLFRTPTTIDKLFDAASSPDQPQPTMQQVQRLVDTVNSRESGSKEACKAARRRLKSKNAQVCHQTLILLDALFNNCGARFHVVVSSRSFIEDIRKWMLAPETNYMLKNQFMTMLDEWTSKLQSEPSLVGLPNLRQYLQRSLFAQSKGQRPMIGGESMQSSSIHDPFSTNTPSRASSTHLSTTNPPSQPHLPNPSTASTSSLGPSPPPPPPQRPWSTAGPETMAIGNQSQNYDVKQVLTVAEGTATMLSETIAFTDTTAEDISKNELIQEFRDKANAFHKQIVGHLEETHDEELLVRLVTCNEQLLSALSLYEEMLEHYHVAQASQISRLEGIVSSVSIQDRPEAGSSGDHLDEAIRSSSPTATFSSPLHSSSSSSSLTTRKDVVSNHTDPFADDQEISERRRGKMPEIVPSPHEVIEDERESRETVSLDRIGRRASSAHESSTFSDPSSSVRPVSPIPMPQLRSADTYHDDQNHEVDGYQAEHQKGEEEEGEGGEKGQVEDGMPSMKPQVYRYPTETAPPLPQRMPSPETYQTQELPHPIPFPSPSEQPHHSFPSPSESYHQSIPLATSHLADQGAESSHPTSSAPPPRTHRPLPQPPTRRSQEQEELIV